MNEASTTSQVQVEVTLTIDGDWRADPLKVVAGIREGSRSLDEWQRSGRRRARAGPHVGRGRRSAGVSRQAA